MVGLFPAEAFLVSNAPLQLIRPLTALRGPAHFSV